MTTGKDKSKSVTAPENLVKGILENNITALSRAITIIESKKPEHQQIAQGLIKACLAYKKETIRIGITGVPGVGKSTFVEKFGKMLTLEGKYVAVLTVDPTSQRTRGSILGDKTRMETLAADPKAFIRPSPSGDTLGGVARKTRESIILLEAAGYDVILIETVGVGQNETAVQGMVDFFLLLKLSGAGDELQGIKRGIIEMADAIAINKADGDNINKAKLAKEEFKQALKLFPPKDNGWTPTVTMCSALENKGLDKIWVTILRNTQQTKQSGYFDMKRKDQNKNWFKEYVEELLKMNFYQQNQVREMVPKLEKKIIEGILSPFMAAEELLAMYIKTKESS
ncbi:methylmalonyl Co-A mutase-associated GTPase MeaB [Maribacter sp. CXY002]|uniref:methylmalonyl Co-A mutase-associated GTPase MeaB n=1 Tax=Maribacter luteocoastalis TaxID=3407671 RepID=UPI003B67385E